MTEQILSQLNARYDLTIHVQDLFAWVLLVAAVCGFLFLVWLFTDTLVTYANRRMR